MPERICDGTCVHQREGRCQLEQDGILGFQACPLTENAKYPARRNHWSQDSILP
ncbi:MAG: hypothetical protein KGZ75_06695 [Syntrophomonadaceae bacterium]|nr:hypothetical protein [Syntrophomonadaceae bacterium]